MLKTNLMSGSSLMMAAIAAAFVGCSSNQSVTVDMNQTAPQVGGSGDRVDGQSVAPVVSAVNSTSIEGQTVHIGSIDWYVDYDTAMKVAKETNKPIWLHFGENPG